MRHRILAALALFALAGTASAQTLDRIKETSSLKIGFRTDAPPLSYLDRDNRPAGYSVAVCGQLVQAIANALELEELDLELVAVTTENRFEAVANGEIDMLCGASTITLARREIVDFSIPTFMDGTAVMLPKDAEANFGALAGKKVGVRSATTTEQALAKTLEDTGVDAEIVTFDAHPDGVGALAAGEISAYFADQSILLYLNLAQNNAQDLKVMGRLLTFEKHGIALPLGDTDFRLLVDGALSGLYASGTMEAIFRETLPGAVPGEAMQALYLTAPILP